MTEPTQAPSLSGYLDIFPRWLASLGDDGAELGKLVADSAGSEAGGASDATRRLAIAGLNYIFKSLDLIPDGIDDLGYCDDAFVIRIAAALACEEEAPSHPESITRLAGEAHHVREFLGAEDYGRLVTYVRGLPKSAARGRTVADIMNDASVRASFLHEVSTWSASYRAPSFSRDIRTLMKVKAFLNAKLA